jgi:UDP-N-acetylmuramoyl-tripeptide--D-alanyl-D-alanine ligase
VIALTAQDVAAVTGGVLAGVAPATVVSGPVVTDSREVDPGALFVALPGENVDGHDFAATAVAAAPCWCTRRVS